MNHPEGLIEDRLNQDDVDPSADASSADVAAGGGATATGAGEGSPPSGPPAPSSAPVQQPRLGPVGWVRFIWRQLTSMRTALLLLMLLAIAAIPGSVLPQNRIDPAKVEQYLNDHPSSGPWLNRLSAFDVYSSSWFSAIYLLLFISLVGCVLPRAAQHWRNVRAQPPRTPRRLDRMPVCIEVETGASQREVLDAARKVLRRRRYRIGPVQDGDNSLAAERGHLAETGNLAFHLALLGVLITIATGSFVAYSGQTVVVTGDDWSNQLLQYDSFTPGRAVDTDDLPPFSITLRSMKVEFDTSAGGNQFGAPRDFEAMVDYQRTPGAATEQQDIRVNHPLKIDGASMFLVGNGYAPVVTIRDPQGKVVSSGATPFQPADGNYTSNGVLKVPDGLKQQVGIVGQLLPTVAAKGAGQLVSVFPDAKDPAIVFTAFTGDLGMNSGRPQSVYALDASGLKQMTVGGKPFSAVIKLGQAVDLPGGLGSVTFEGLQRYAAFDVRHDPTKLWVLAFALTALAGLTVSLFVHRRRVWVRAVPSAVPAESGAGITSEGRTVVQVAGLSRTEDAGLQNEIENVLAALPVTAPETQPASAPMEE